MIGMDVATFAKGIRRVARAGVPAAEMAARMQDNAKALRQVQVTLSDLRRAGGER
jgi:hypothetical protein